MWAARIPEPTWVGRNPINSVLKKGDMHLALRIV